MVNRKRRPKESINAYMDRVGKSVMRDAVRKAIDKGRVTELASSVDNDGLVDKDTVQLVARMPGGWVEIRLTKTRRQTKGLAGHDA